MTNLFQEPEVKIGVITKVLQTAVSFARIKGSDEQVYVRSSLSQLAQIDVGDTVEMMLVRNRNTVQNNTCPWFALRVHKIASPSLDVRGQIELFLAGNGPALTSKIADFLGMPIQGARTYLLSMNDAERIAKADIYARGKNQSRASYTVWALTAQDLLPEVERNDE